MSTERFSEMLGMLEWKSHLKILDYSVTSSKSSSSSLIHESLQFAKFECLVAEEKRFFEKIILDYEKFVCYCLKKETNQIKADLC